MKNKSPKCVKDCIFIRLDKNNNFRCKLYNKKLKQLVENDPYDKGVVLVPLRHKKCLKDKIVVDIKHKIKDMKDLYDVFVYEMDLMFDELKELENKRNNIIGDKIKNGKN